MNTQQAKYLISQACNPERLYLLSVQEVKALEAWAVTSEPVEISITDALAEACNGSPDLTRRLDEAIARGQKLETECGFQRCELANLKHENKELSVENSRLRRKVEGLERARK